MYNKETQMTTKRLKTKSTQNITKHLWKDEEKISNRRKVTKAKRQKKIILKLKTSLKRHTATTKIQNYNKEAGKKTTETQNEVKETNMITERHKQPQRDTLKKRIENNHKMPKNGLKEMNTDHKEIQS